jgi:ABC-2 type transport system permease protein
MNTFPEPHAAVPAQIPVMRRLYWSVRRELWENRYLYVAPLAFAAIYLFAFLIGTITLPQRMRAIFALDAMHQHTQLGEPYFLGAGLIMVAVFVVGVFYCLEALQSERRDRSILFWKSLPVSDLITVLSKMSIPMLVLPLLTFAIMFTTHFIMLVLSMAVLMASGMSVAAYWSHLSLFHLSMLLIYHFVTVHVIWYAPVYAWLLLVSAWAKRVAVLWAVLPLVVIGVIERIAFDSSHFVWMVLYRLSGSSEGASMKPSDGMPGSMDMMLAVDLGKFLSSPALWIGLILAAAFLAAAVRLRRFREPI